jgi:hypothetical protein
MQGEKLRKIFLHALAAPFLVGPSTVHGMPESTDFLIDLVSDPHVLGDNDKIPF